MPTPPFRLADFLVSNVEPLLQDWEDFARTIPSAKGFDVEQLRDHARDMLCAIAADLRAPQSAAEQFTKSQGLRRPSVGDTAAEVHGAARYSEGFDLNELVTEYRALRATVVRQWTARGAQLGPEAADDLVRFNEALDQALTEGIRRFERDWARDRRLLQDAQLRLQSAVDAAHLGVWDLDLATGAVPVRSRRHDQMFGYDGLQPEWTLEIAERHVLEEDRPLFRAAFDRARDTGVLAFEARVRWPDGSIHWIAPRGRTRYDEEGRAIGMAGVVADVTESHEIENRLRLADRRKDEFLAVLAHELRNPLAPLATGLEILARRGNGDADVVAQQVSRMKRQLGLLVRLVDDLLDVSRISRGAITLKREVVSLPNVVRQAMEASMPLIERKSHRLTLDVQAESIRVLGDRTRLVQVFANLVNNAAKYSDPHAEITIDVRSDARCAVVTVSDDGPGIAPEQRSRVFEMFAQGAPDRIAQQREGLGIGLWLARTLVEQHGGTIELRERAPRGCRFIVTLALHRDGPEPGEPAQRSLPQATSSLARRVLVVDDNRDAGEALGEWLTMLGHEVRIERDGAAALAAAEAFRPEIVLLDIGMRGLNGYDVARQLRLRRGDRSPVLVAVTGWGQAEDRQRSRDAGFDHHLVKPPDPGQLLEILTRRT